jgi:broad specificity phosphatase PhoE
MTSLYLIRHGQAGPRQRYDELSTLGREQARRLGDHFALRRVRFDAVVSGTLNRQRETALAIEDAYRQRATPLPAISLNPRWDEFDWSGIYDEMSARLARDDERFREAFERLGNSMRDEDNSVHRVHHYCDIEVIRAWLEERYPYKGETWSAFRARVLEPLAAIPANGSGSTVAVVTSATPVGIWAGRALDLDDRNIWRLAGAMHNSGISRFEAKNGKLRMISFNETPHLDDPSLLSVR